MDLNRFQLLLDVVRCGSLSRAAIARGVPQSWVSRHISALEGDCGGRLLDRTGRGVELSQFGRDMMPMIEEVLTKANALSSQLAEYGSSPRGEVTVGLLPSFVPTTASHLFAEVSRRLPNVKLTLVEGSSVEIEHWLEDGSLDIGLVTRKDAGLGVEVIKKRVPLYLVGPKGDPYTMNPTVPFAKLSRLPLILPRTPSAMRPLIDGVAKRNGVELYIVMESDSFSVQLALAASGAAYAILGAYAVRHAITHEGALSASKIVSPTIERAIAVAMSSKRRPNEAIRGVARLLRSVLTETIEAQ
jgi:LysR family nitrogen assimilation transcriptional regulator